MFVVARRHLRGIFFKKLRDVLANGKLTLEFDWHGESILVSANRERVHRRVSMATNPGNPDHPKSKLPEQLPAVQVNPFAELHRMFDPAPTPSRPARRASRGNDKGGGKGGGGKSIRISGGGNQGTTVKKKAKKGKRKTETRKRIYKK